MSMMGLILICGGVLLAAAAVGLIGLLVYHFTQKDRKDE